MVAVSLCRSARVATRRLPTTSELDVKSSIPILRAEVAQAVEQRTENPRVSGSTPLLGTMYVVFSSNLGREQKTILAVMLVMERLQRP